MNQPHVEHEERAAAETPGALASAPGAGVRAVAGPFGLRDIVVGAAVLVMLVGSVLPFAVAGGRNLWTVFSLFYVGIGIIMPLLVAGLFAARRLAPSVRLRVGSLSLDQFASVIAVLAAIFFFLQLVYVFSIGSLLGFIGAVALLAATTFAPHIPPFSAEFSNRTEIPAHPVARDAKPLLRAPKPVPAPKPENAGGPSGAGPAGAFGQPGPSAAGPAAAGPAAAGPATGAQRPVQGAPAGAQQPGTQSAPGSEPTANTGTQPAAGRPAGTGAGAAAAGVAAAGAAGAGAGASSAAAGAGDSATGTPAPEPSGSAPEPGAPESAAAEPGAPGSRAQEPRTSAGEDPLPATTVNPAVRGGAPGSEQPAPESISATREENENVVEAFWFAVGTPRQIVDERTGLPLFMFYPGDWELGLEDRGHEFLVQDKRTGRIGVLRDLTNIERVSDDSSGH
ncbi:hypothetical protein [Arthrobacter sp. BL-252-APC-1A]|uniref:hypothetical protein n=1 Tax=Arthrobacter sp. BL-252-APC-1A TaxID=2606622 RepID=UPI001E353318|nr:hypothetical protein [Arthrobacter sp. BL-252-APC-1A]